MLEQISMQGFLELGEKQFYVKVLVAVQTETMPHQIILDVADCFSYELPLLPFMRNFMSLKHLRKETVLPLPSLKDDNLIYHMSKSYQRYQKWLARDVLVIALPEDEITLHLQISDEFEASMKQTRKTLGIRFKTKEVPCKPGDI